MIRGLQRCAGAIVFAWLATLAFGVSAEQGGATQVEQTPIERSTSSVTATEQASRWGLTLEDWTRYQSLMTGPRGVWSPNLDPVTALGVHADTDAGGGTMPRSWSGSSERMMRELAFEKVVQEVKRELYPNEPLLDSEKLKTLLEARTREPPYRAGDRMLLFVKLDCGACDRLAQYLASEVQSLLVYSSMCMSSAGCGMRTSRHGRRGSSCHRLWCCRDGSPSITTARRSAG